MSTLRITVLQAPLEWQDTAANLVAFERRIRALDQPADIILLPETFSTGFCRDGFRPNRAEAEKTLDWMLALAKATEAAICGSLITDLGSFAVNRLVFARPDGLIETYDKVHLFRAGGEHEAFRPGTQRVTFTYKGWRILPIVCNDLRFPVFMRSRDDYDLILCVANWPAPRRAAWDILLRARAIENVAYAAGANRVGHDRNGWDYPGLSLIADHLGATLASLPEGEEGTLRATLDLGALRTFRESYPVLQDADRFELKRIP